MQLLLFPFLAFLFLKILLSISRMAWLFLLDSQTLFLFSFAACVIFLSLISSFDNSLAKTKAAFLQTHDPSEYKHLIANISHISHNSAEEIAQHDWKQLRMNEKKELLSSLQTERSLEAQISYWESILKLQTTDRDVLINLAALYARNNQPNKAKASLEFAKQIDPNYSY